MRHRHMDERSLQIERRFDAVDERFREMLGHFDETCRRLERLEPALVLERPAGAL